MPLRLAVPAASEPTTFDAAGLVTAPAILVMAAACGILLVLALDLRRLRRAARLTFVHGIVSGGLALAVVGLAVLFASGLAQVPAASANGNETDAPHSTDSLEVLPLDPLEGVQLPTLAD